MAALTIIMHCAGSVSPLKSVLQAAKKQKDMEIHEYVNGEVTVLWEPKLCIHSAICVKTLPNVYDPKARPWIRPENATGDELIAQIAKCPSGALSIKGESKMSNKHE